MCILEKLNFKISPGSTPPDPTRVIAPSALDTIFARLTMGNSQYYITYLNHTHTHTHTHTQILFSLEKGTPSVLYRDMYFKDCCHIRSAQAKSAPPHRKSCVRACFI